MPAPGNLTSTPPRTRCVRGEERGGCWDQFSEHSSQGGDKNAVIRPLQPNLEPRGSGAETKEGECGEATETVYEQSGDTAGCSQAADVPEESRQGPG